MSFVILGDVRQAQDCDGNKSHKKQRGDFAGAKALVKEREDKCHKYFTRIKESRGLVARGTTTIKGIKVLKLEIPKEDMLQDDEDESMFDRVSCKVVPPALGHGRQIVWEMARPSPSSRTPVKMPSPSTSPARRRRQWHCSCPRRSPMKPSTAASACASSTPNAAAPTP